MEAYTRAGAEAQGCKVGMGPNDPYFWVSVQSGLSSAEDLRDTSIFVDVENGAITLRGLVGIPAQKEKAERIAKRVSDLGFINALAVSPNAPEVIRKIDSMKSGNIAFDVPASMYVQDTISAFLLLSATESHTALKNKIEEMNRKDRKDRRIKEAQRPSHLETAKVQFSGFMEAKLVGPGFEITPITPERQIVNNTQETKWRWDIKAKDPGEQHLHLTMNAVFKIEGSEQLYLVQVFDKVITVNVSWRTWVAAFISNNWQWLWAVAVGPLLVPIWRRLRKKKDEPPPSWEKP